MVKKKQNKTKVANKRPPTKTVASAASKQTKSVANAVSKAEEVTEAEVVDAPEVTEAEVVDAPEEVTEVVDAPEEEDDTRSGLAVKVGEILDGYEATMAPGQAQTEERVISSQRNLWDALMQILTKSSDEEFSSLWSDFLIRFNNNKETGCYQDRLVGRGITSKKGKQILPAGFARLIVLADVTSDPSDRANVTKKLDLSKTVEDLPAIASERLINFYT